MSKDTVSAWDTTPANNTDVGGVDLAENSMRPRDVNNAIRTMMAQIRTALPTGTGIGGSTGATDNRLLRADGVGGSTVQNSSVAVDDSGNMSGVGTLAATGIVSVNFNTAALLGGPAGTALELQGADATQLVQLLDTFAASPTFIARRSEGTKASPSAMGSGSVIFSFQGRGYGSTGYSLGRVAFNMRTSQVWTDANQGTEIIWQTTPNNSTTLTTMATFGQDGSLKLNVPTGGLGYVTGAGGTVTQASNKSTGVTLDKVCGAVTMNNASLAAATIVSFTLTNSAIAAGDVLILNHVSGGTIGAYTLNAACGAGSAVVSVRNNTAGSLSDAIVIQFAVIKGVSA